MDANAGMRVHESGNCQADAQHLLLSQTLGLKEMAQTIANDICDRFRRGIQFATAALQHIAVNIAKHERRISILERNAEHVSSMFIQGQEYGRSSLPLAVADHRSFPDQSGLDEFTAQ